MNHPPDTDPAAHHAVLHQAVQDLDALIATGPAPERVMEAIGTLVASWAGEPDMSTDVMLVRVENLWDGLASQAAALQEQLSDMEDGPAGATTQGRRVLAALDAAVATLAAISAR